MKTIGWVLGWAVPETWFAPLAEAAFPAARHSFFAAEPGWLDRLRSAGPFDLIVGHSLGAHLLLDHAPQTNAAKVALLAPVLRFPTEAGCGGRVALTQVKFLARWLRRDQPAALADFYARAGLDVPAELGANLPSATLQWGLEHLSTLAPAPVFPAHWTGWCGSADTLLDANTLHNLAPAIRIAPGATHHPATLFGELAREVA